MTNPLVNSCGNQLINTTCGILNTVRDHWLKSVYFVTNALHGMRNLIIHMGVIWHDVIRLRKWGACIDRQDEILSMLSVPDKRKKGIKARSTRWGTTRILFHANRTIFLSTE